MEKRRCIYISAWASCVARSIGLGNARASVGGTSDGTDAHALLYQQPKNAESGASAGDVILMRTKIKFMWLCVLLLIAGKAQAWISYPTAGYLTATNEDGISIEYEIFNIDGQMVASPWEVKDPTLVLNIPAEIVSRQGTVYPVTWIHALRCNNVSVLNLPNSIKIINSISADSLTYLRVPDSVTEISEDAFIYVYERTRLDTHPGFSNRWQ